MTREQEKRGMRSEYHADTKEHRNRTQVESLCHPIATAVTVIIVAAANSG